MSKPKDPEVIDEMRASGRLPPEDDAADDIADVMPEPATKELASEGDDADDGASKDVEHADDFADDGPRAADLIEDPHEDHRGRSVAATALMILVGILAVAMATLWAAPRVAPHLPAGVAKYLLPGQMKTAAEVDVLRDTLTAETERSATLSATLATRIAALETALGAMSDQVEGLAPATEAAASTATEALALATDATTQVTALTPTVDGRLDAIAAELTELRDSTASLRTALTAAATTTGSDSEANSPALAAAVAALDNRIDSLAGTATNRADLRALDDRIDALAARLDAVENSTADARSVQTEALDEVSSAIRQASLRAATTMLTSQIESGQPYAAPLGEVAALTGDEPPPALSAAAEAGIMSVTALDASFGPYAQAAVAADVQAGAGEGTRSQVLGWMRAQVTGRPITEQQGDSVGAITSRIAARTGEGALGAALAEAEALPPHSQAALGDWLTQLRARVAAEAALAAWLSAIGVSG